MAPTLAHAQAKARAATTQTPVVATPPKDEAGRLFEEATAAHDAGKVEQAEALFSKAWALKKSWDIAANLGVVERKLGKHAAAATLFAEALRLLPPSEADATRAGIERRLAAAREDVGAVKVHVGVDGAKVRIGGEQKGTTPIDGELFVMPGTITIDVEADGYEPASKTIELAKGKTEDVTFSLARKAPPAGPSMVPMFLIGGAAGVGVLLGIGTAAGAAVVSGDAEKLGKQLNPAGNTALCAGAAGGDCDVLLQKRRQQGLLENVALWSFIGAGAAGSAALIYALGMRTADGQRTAIVLSPVMSGTGQPGVLLSGAW
jgi:hypothetical protein